MSGNQLQCYKVLKCRACYSGSSSSSSTVGAAAVASSLQSISSRCTASSTSSTTTLTRAHVVHLNRRFKYSSALGGGARVLDTHCILATAASQSSS
eukprot:2744-Heterococcus_DN1.PRE.1